MESRYAHKRELQIVYLTRRLQFPALSKTSHNKRQGNQRARHLLSQPHRFRADIREQIYHGYGRIYAARQHDESPHSIRREECIPVKRRQLLVDVCQGHRQHDRHKGDSAQNLNKPCVIESEFFAANGMLGLNSAGKQKLGGPCNELDIVYVK